MKALQWIIANQEVLVAGVSATLAGILILCKLTPSPKDDGVVAKILDWLNMIPKKK